MPDPEAKPLTPTPPRWVYPGDPDPAKCVATCWRCHTKYVCTPGDPYFTCEVCFSQVRVMDASV